MKTCKYGCGKMKDGGKVTAIKKMAKGGATSKPCPLGQCKNNMGICKPCASSNLGGIITGTLASIVANAAGGKMRQAKKLAKAAEKASSTAKAAAVQEGTEKKKRGGSIKKYQSGGSMIVGMPKYSNNPRTDAGRILQAGGSFAPNRPVQTSCKNGMVRDANGKCVMMRTMQKGGFPDLNKDGKITKADILKGRGVIKKLGGSKKR